MGCDDRIEYFLTNDNIKLEALLRKYASTKLQLQNFDYLNKLSILT